MRMKDETYDPTTIINDQMAIPWMISMVLNQMESMLQQAFKQNLEEPAEPVPPKFRRQPWGANHS